MESEDVSRIEEANTNPLTGCSVIPADAFTNAIVCLLSPLDYAH